MKVDAITTEPPKWGVKYEDIDVEENLPIKLKPVYTGICGTDRGIVSGSLPFAYAPHGKQKLILGHECLAKVIEAEDNDLGIKTGDYVVPIVRRPGKCVNCLIGRSDNCSDGDKHEAGITGLNGFMRSEFQDHPQNLVRVEDPDIASVAVLTEPLKNVKKAFEMFDTVSRKSVFTDANGAYDEKRAIIIGTGSEAFLYGLASRDYGFQTHMANRHPETESKLRMMEKSNINFYDYTKDTLVEKNGFDLAVDTSGDPATIFRFIRKMNNNGIIILFGTNGNAPASTFDGSDIDYIIERNITILGSVDGSRIHYERALQDLTRWNYQYGDLISNMITSRVKPDNTDIFLHKQPGEIKTVIEWS